jgi:hypothetical protein
VLVRWSQSGRRKHGIRSGAAVAALSRPRETNNEVDDLDRAVLAVLTAAASAQSTTRSFYNSSGQSVGRATTQGNTMTFYNSNGQSTGRAARSQTLQLQ